MDRSKWFEEVVTSVMAHPSEEEEYIEEAWQEEWAEEDSVKEDYQEGLDDFRAEVARAVKKKKLPEEGARVRVHPTNTNPIWEGTFRGEAHPGTLLAGVCSIVVGLDGTEWEVLNTIIETA